VGVHHRQREVVGHAAAAVDLDRPVDDPQGEVRRGDLDRRDLRPGVLVADRVDQPRRLEREQADHLQLDPRLRHPVQDVGARRDRRAERLALQRAPAQQLQRALRGPDRAHAVVDAAGPEPRLGDHEAVALARDEVGGGDADVLEQQLGVPLRVHVAEHGQVAQDRQPGRVARDEDHRLLLVRGPVRIRLAHDDEDPAALAHRPGGPPLAAVEDVLVALALDAQLDVARVGGGHVGLGHRERGADLAVEQRLQPLRLLLRRPELGEDLHVARVRRRAVDGLGGEVAGAAGDLRQRRVLAVGEAGPVFGIGVEEVPQAAPAGLGLELLHHGRMEVRVAALADLGRVDGLGGVDVLVHEGGQPLGEVPAALGRCEVHARIVPPGRAAPPPGRAA